MSLDSVIHLQSIIIKSDAFENDGFIPEKFTCQGVNINPALHFEKIPKGTKSLALIVDDPDAPIRPWVHWIVWNIAPTQTIKENSIPGLEGLNDYNQHHYSGPCPPKGTHKYFFKVYALDDLLTSNIHMTKSDLEKMMKPHIIGYGELTGFYKKK